MSPKLAGAYYDKPAILVDWFSPLGSQVKGSEDTFLACKKLSQT